MSTGIGNVQATTDNVLSNMVVGFRNQAYQLQGIVMPIISSAKRKGSYWLFGKEAFQDEAEYIGSTGESPRLTRNLTEGTFTLKPIGAAIENSWDVADEAPQIVKNQMQSSEYVTDKMMLKLERLIASTLTTTGNWTTTTAISSGSEWDTAGGGDPLGFFETAALAIYDLIGVPAEELTTVLPYKVGRCLRKHPQLRDYLKFMNGTAPSIVTPDMIAEIIGYKRVIISKAQYNTALKGLTASLSGMMSDTVWVGYCPDRPAIMAPAAGYSLELEGEQMIRTYIESKNRRDVIDGVKHIGVEITCADAGYTGTNCLA